ncbi:MAG: phospho-sugar mutase [Gemmataceae bacterium]|nr:phospho-sugar mutase [Gemmataceae bacterium]
MGLLERAAEGFATVTAPEAAKASALRYLGQWLADDGFRPYRPQIERLIETAQWPGLLDRFYQILPFGTGGRRGAVGIGPNRMNPWTLAASVQGHCEYLRENFRDAATLRVALAYDVRQFEDQRRQYDPGLPNPVLHLSSRALAQQAAAVYAANGIHAHILPPDSKAYLATPELSYAIRQLRAHGGLNISASHNPPDDNGGKFYDERGGQPVPPEDQIMADLVDQVGEIKTLPWPEAVRTGRIHFFDDSLHQAYLDLCRRQSLIPPPTNDDFKVVFTPLHGVGSMTAQEVLTQHGFRVIPVPEQAAPDGQFPNVTKTPNPEVPESMDKAAALALAQKADLVLATDPDADRLGAMAPGRDGAWRPLPGNEIAAMLTLFKLSKLSRSGRLPPSPLVVTTEVTTRLITRIARHFRAQVVDHLLVGFKYMADVLRQLEDHGSFDDVQGTVDDFVIATEESHGAMLTASLRDKDAGAAALMMAEIALDQKRKGRTVLDYAEEMYRQFGYFCNLGVSVAMTGIEGKQQMAAMMESLRSDPPKSVAGLAVTGFEDLRDPEGKFGPIKGATDAASRNVLLFRFGDLGRVALRPSGTEPKAKAYVEACSPPCPPSMPPEAWARQKAEVDARAQALADDFVKQATARAK